MEEIIDAWVMDIGTDIQLHEFTQVDSIYVYRCSNEGGILFEGEGSLPSEAIVNAGWAALARAMES